MSEREDYRLEVIRIRDKSRRRSQQAAEVFQEPRSKQISRRQLGLRKWLVSHVWVRGARKGSNCRIGDWPHTEKEN